MIDCISRQAVLDKLNEWEWQELYLPIHFKENIIDELPSVTPTERTGHWISVSERLPEQGKDHFVLVTVRHKDPTYKGYDVCIAEYDTRDYECEWKFRTGWTDENLYVSAWMPLPEPYEPQESEDKDERK